MLSYKIFTFFTISCYLVAAFPVVFDFTGVDTVVYGRGLNATAQAQSIVNILTDLKISLDSAVQPFASSDASITADVVADVQAQAADALQKAIDASGLIQVEVNVVGLNMNEIMSIVSQLTACMRIIARAFAKVNLKADLAVTVRTIDTLLSVLVQLILHISGGLGSVLLAQLSMALKAASALGLLSSLDFSRTIAVCNL